MRVSCRRTPSRVLYSMMVAQAMWWWLCTECGVRGGTSKWYLFVPQWRSGIVHRRTANAELNGLDTDRYGNSP